MRFPTLLTAAIASFAVPPSFAEAQIRVARPRPVVAVRPVVVARPTVFIGGYYFPTLYRTSLWYGPYGYGGYYPYPAYAQWPYGPGRYDLSGSIRVQVSPRNAEVFVDGYFAGSVDDFDGIFQRLRVEPGEHEVQIYLAGYRPFQTRIYVQPGKTFHVKHDLEPLAPGETAPPRPQGVPVPPPGARSGGPGRQGPYPPEPRGRRDGAANTPDAVRPAEGFGSLSLRVQPSDAEVLLDGERWQGSVENERLVVQLGTGTHTIEIRKDGHRSYITDVTIVAGQERSLNVVLSKQ